MDGFSGNFQDMQDRAISVISKSFTYNWVMYYMAKQVYSFYVITLRHGRMRPRTRPREQLLLQNYKA